MSEVAQAGIHGRDGVAVSARPAGTGLGRLTNLQALRALAAAFVVLLHAAAAASVFHQDPQFLRLFNGHLGSFGVALFFAISGFLMVQLVRATRPGMFLSHRIARIYPIYLVIVVAWIAVAPIVLADPPSLDWASLTLAPAGRRTYALGSVEWTLIHEMMFYLGLFLISAAGWARHIELIAVGWLALIAAVSISGSEAAIALVGPHIHTILLAEANAPFAGGLLIPWLLQRGLVPARLCLLAIPFAAFAIVAELEPFRWMLGIPAILIVAALVQVRQIPVRGAMRGGLVRFGDWSYVLYLVHQPVLLLLYGLAPAWIPSIPLFLAALAGVLAAAAILGPLDLAIYQRLRSFVDRADRRYLTAFCAGFLAVYVAIGGAFLAVHLRDQADASRARAALARLPAGSLSDPASLAAAVDASAIRAPASFSGALDRAVNHADGQTLVFGWGIDAQRPSDVVQLAIACSGKIAVMGRPQRYRPDVATRLGQQAWTRRRFGFTLTIGSGACPPDVPLIPVFIDGQGRLATGAPVTAMRPARVEPRTP